MAAKKPNPFAKGKAPPFGKKADAKEDMAMMKKMKGKSKKKC